MKANISIIIVCLFAIANVTSADTFSTGSNQFTIDFVPISGDVGNLGSWSAGGVYTFSGVNHGDYRMGTYEITNDQWNKYKAAYGTVTGTPLSAYDANPNWSGSSVPTNIVSWYEAAQFVNFLNTSKGYQAAYKFTGTQGTSGYTLDVWSASDAGYNAANPYRNSNAFYFLPTENEWVKAAYWNGSVLQTYSNASAGDLVSGSPDIAKWNYTSSAGSEPWTVGSGVEELNGTYDMMGNVREWMESPYTTGDYTSNSYRGFRGGSYNTNVAYLRLSYRDDYNPVNEYEYLGFRVASVPEPATLLLLGLSGLALRYGKR